jgi:hypothetical protein
VILDKMQKLLEIDKEFKLELEPSKCELYDWLRNQLDEVVYNQLSKKQKGIVLKFIKRITGYSKKQIKRLIQKYKQKKLFWNKQIISFVHTIYEHKKMGTIACFVVK